MRARAFKAIQERDTLLTNEDQVDLLPGDSADPSQPRTMFEEILSSKLPLEEKSAKRISEEAIVIISAGSDTIGRTLTCSTFHLLDNPDALCALKKELLEAMPEAGAAPNLRDLEQLPFLVRRLTIADVFGRTANTISCHRRRLSKNRCVWLALLRLACRLYLPMWLFSMGTGSFQPA